MSLKYYRCPRTNGKCREANTEKIFAADEHWECPCGHPQCSRETLTPVSTKEFVWHRYSNLIISGGILVLPLVLLLVCLCNQPKQPTQEELSEYEEICQMIPRTIGVVPRSDIYVETQKQLKRKIQEQTGLLSNLQQAQREGQNDIDEQTQNADHTMADLLRQVSHLNRDLADAKQDVSQSYQNINKFIDIEAKQQISDYKNSPDYKNSISHKKRNTLEQIKSRLAFSRSKIRDSIKKFEEIGGIYYQDLAEKYKNQEKRIDEKTCIVTQNLNRASQEEQKYFEFCESCRTTSEDNLQKALAVPEISVDPNRRPLPPPFDEKEADLKIVGTGDLPENLITPLIESWAKDLRASSKTITYQRKQYITILRKDNSSQKQRKLCILVSSPEKISPYSQLLDGSIHLYISGIPLSDQDLAQYAQITQLTLPTGIKNKTWATQQIINKKRNHKLRIAWDAATIIPGTAYQKTSIPVENLASMSKIIFPEGTAEREAMVATKIYPTTADQKLTTEEMRKMITNRQREIIMNDLRTRARNSIIMSVYHKDSRSIRSHALGTPNPMAPETPYKPTDDNIRCQLYALSYPICAYRTPSEKGNRKDNEYVNQLVSYISKIGGNGQKTVEECSFISITPDDTPLQPKWLDDMEAPISMIVKNLPSQYGYTLNDAKVYGMQIKNFPIYFEFDSTAPIAYEKNTEARHKETFADHETIYLWDSVKEIIREAYSSYDYISFIIAAHTDKVGSNEYNLRLSNSRASSVSRQFNLKTFLQKISNSETPIIPLGCSYNRPISNEETPEGRAKNRRAEFFLILPKPNTTHQ